MKKRVTLITLILILCITIFAGCNQAKRVSYNLSKEADNFNTIRRITVINCIGGDILFTMVGKMSITADTEDNQLEIVIEDGDGSYKKHFIGLSDNVTYVVEDLQGNVTSKYQYTMNYNPKMWIPVDFKNID